MDQKTHRTDVPSAKASVPNYSQRLVDHELQTLLDKLNQLVAQHEAVDQAVAKSKKLIEQLDSAARVLVDCVAVESETESETAMAGDEQRHRAHFSNGKRGNRVNDFANRVR